MVSSATLQFPIKLVCFCNGCLPPDWNIQDYLIEITCNIKITFIYSLFLEWIFVNDPDNWIFCIYSTSCFCCIFPLRFVSSHDQILRVQLAEAPARVHAGGRLLRQVWWGRKVLTTPEVLCIDYRLFSPSCYHPHTLKDHYSKAHTNNRAIPPFFY